jgi:hypothetical protein
MLQMRRIYLLSLRNGFAVIAESASFVFAGSVSDKTIQTKLDCFASLEMT